MRPPYQLPATGGGLHAVFIIIKACTGSAIVVLLLVNPTEQTMFCGHLGFDEMLFGSTFDASGYISFPSFVWPPLTKDLAPLVPVVFSTSQAFIFSWKPLTNPYRAWERGYRLN